MLDESFACGLIPKDEIPKMDILIVTPLEQQNNKEINKANILWDAPMTKRKPQF